MGTIMIFYTIVSSHFSHMVSGVFAQAFVIYIFKFFSLDFLNIVLILCDVQVLKGECYNTIFIYDHLYTALATTVMSATASAVAC
jgi:hypothetical protein